MIEEIIDFELIITPADGKIFAADPGFIACRRVEVSFEPEDYTDITSEDPATRAKYVVEITEGNLVGLHFPNGARMRDHRDKLHRVDAVYEVPKTAN